MPLWLDLLLKIMGALGFLLALAGIVYQAGRLSQRVTNVEDDVQELKTQAAASEKEAKRDRHDLRNLIFTKHGTLRKTLTDHGQMLAVLVASCPNCPVERIKEVVDRNITGEPPEEDPLQDNPTFNPGGRGELGQSNTGRTAEPE